MGDLVKISCNDCGWSIGGSIGMGFWSFKSLKDAKHSLSTSLKNKITRACNGDKDPIGTVSFNRVIVCCKQCNQIGFREHTRVNVIVDQESIEIENKFRCNRCRRPVKQVTNEAWSGIICPMCEKESVDIDYLGLWD